MMPLLTRLALTAALLSPGARADFCAAAAPPPFDVTAFGAVGDGVTLNTAAIARAIAAAAAAASPASPQRVLFPDGVFYSGQVVVASHVTLCIQGRLLASSNASDYPVDQTKWVFVFAEGASDFGIGGGGVIDGDYRKYVTGYDAEIEQYLWAGWPNCEGECRPRLVAFHDSVDIVIDSITFTGSPDWTTHLLNCTRVLLQNFTQFGDERWPNNDGVDIDSSSHVLIADSRIDTADDGVCIKGSTVGGRVYNVTVRNTTVRSRSSAIKFGSNCGIPMAELLFENITVLDSNRGLAIQARDGPCDGGFCIQNVTFRDILINGTRFWPLKWWGDGSPIYISTMLRTAEDGASGVRNVTFENITAFSQGSAVLSGRAPGGNVSGVLLRNVEITIDRRPSWNYSSEQGVFPNIEYDPSSIPLAGPPHNTRVDMTGWMPGLFVERVEGLVLDGVDIRFSSARQPYWGDVCVNTSAAEFPVTVIGGSCTRA